MVHKSFILILSVLLCLSVTSCKKIKGKGDVVTEDRTVTGFTGVSLSIDANTYVREDSIFHVEIQAQQNILDVIETPVEDGSLVIKLKDHTILGKHDQIMVMVSAPYLNNFAISGSGRLEVQSDLTHPLIYMGVSGSGDMSIQSVMTSELRASISGSGNMNISNGTAHYEYPEISGSGNINFSGVVTDTCYANISGSGNITVNVLKLLDGTISGSGNINYYGSPVVNAHISGSGSINHW